MIKRLQNFFRRRAQKKHKAALEEQRRFERELERQMMHWDNQALKTPQERPKAKVATPVAPRAKQKQEARFSQEYEASRQRGYVDDGSSDLLTPLLIMQVMETLQPDSGSSSSSTD